MNFLLAILEAEKANDKAADVPVESANLEGYEVHLALLEKRIKEAISVMSTWERWIPVELKDELDGRVKDVSASYYRLELRRAEFATARTINEQGTGVKLLPQPAASTPIVRINQPLYLSSMEARENITAGGKTGKACKSRENHPDQLKLRKFSSWRVWMTKSQKTSDFQHTPLPMTYSESWRTDMATSQPSLWKSLKSWRRCHM